MDVKTCNGCKSEKPITEFYVEKRKKGVTRCHVCKKCKNAQLDVWRRKNKQRVYEYNQKWYYRIGRYKDHGITRKQFDLMFSAQNGGCAICSRPTSCKTGDAFHGGLHIDHDHKTGVVRGLLCGNCNTALGKFQDSPELLLVAVEYLLAARKMNAVKAAGHNPLVAWLGAEAAI